MGLAFDTCAIESSNSHSYHLNRKNLRGMKRLTAELLVGTIDAVFLSVANINRVDTAKCRADKLIDATGTSGKLSGQVHRECAGRSCNIKSSSHILPDYSFTRTRIFQVC